MIFKPFTAYKKHNDKKWRPNQRILATIIANARIILLLTLWSVLILLINKNNDDKNWSSNQRKIANNISTKENAFIQKKRGK